MTKKEKEINVFIKSNKTFETKSGRLEGQKQYALPQSEAESLLKMYPNDFIKSDEASLASAGAKLKETLKILKDENATLEKEVLSLRKENEDLLSGGAKLKETLEKEVLSLKKENKHLSSEIDSLLDKKPTPKNNGN